MFSESWPACLQNSEEWNGRKIAMYLLCNSMYFMKLLSGEIDIGSESIETQYVAKYTYYCGWQHKYKAL